MEGGRSVLGRREEGGGRNEIAEGERRKRRRRGSMELWREWQEGGEKSFLLRDEVPERGDCIGDGG